MGWKRSSHRGASFRNDPPIWMSSTTFDARSARRSQRPLPFPSNSTNQPSLIGVSGTIMSVMGVALDLDDMRQAVAEGEGQTLRLTDDSSDLRRPST